MTEISRSDEHAIARHKRITGSRVSTIMTGGPAAWDTLSDLLHNPEPEKFYDPENTPNMPEQLKRGHKYEPMAKGEFFFRHEEYELEDQMFCYPCDDVDDDLQEWIGVSPDARLIPNSGLEVKVPAMEKHLAWREAGILPLEHLPQCALSLLVTGADHWWFCSFCPELEGEERYFEIKLEREEIYLEHMKLKIRTFLEGHIANKIFDTSVKQEVIPASSFPVVKFNVTDEAIAVLAERYGGMEEPKTTAEYAVVAAAHKDMVKRRTGVDKIYIKTTEEAKDFIAGIKTEQKRLLGLMEPTETHLKSLRGTWEDEQKRIKEEAEAKEAERVDNLRSLIEWMNVEALKAFEGMTSESIVTQIETIKTTEIKEEIYQEFYTEAENAKTALISRAEEYLAKTIAEEEEAARLAQEQKELRERNEQLERENDERLEREADEEKERDRVKEIDNELTWIKESVLESMDGDINKAKGVRLALKKAGAHVREIFQEKAEEAEALLEKTIRVVEKIIADKQAELDEAEANKSDPEEEAEALKPLTDAIATHVEASVDASNEVEEEEVGPEELFLLDYTASTKWDQIKELNWTTAEVMDVLKLYKEKS